MTKPRLSISFSGGRTSAVMTKLLLERFGTTHDIHVVFANTGCEHPATLDFVRDCDKHFGFNTVWIEAIVSPVQGEGIRPKIVTYETASRDGGPFRAYIAKHGLPNAAAQNCTSRLKVDPLTYYREHIVGWKRGTFDTAIGIRADEVDRVSTKAKELRYIYPLVTWGYTKERVLDECATWPFDLRIPGEHYGNCVWCWKKSLRKLLTIAKNDVEQFRFPLEMDALYGQFKLTPASVSPDGKRKMFRKHMDTWDIIEMAHFGPEFEEFQDHRQLARLTELDVGSACGESGEIGTEETDSVPDEE